VIRSFLSGSDKEFDRQLVAALGSEVSSIEDRLGRDDDEAFCDAAYGCSWLQEQRTHSAKHTAKSPVTKPTSMTLTCDGNMRSATRRTQRKSRSIRLFDTFYPRKGRIVKALFSRLAHVSTQSARYRTQKFTRG
jgi:hypothetical protein